MNRTTAMHNMPCFATASCTAAADSFCASCRDNRISLILDTVLVSIFVVLIRLCVLVLAQFLYRPGAKRRVFAGA